VLRDVFYIQDRQNPATKPVASVLIKRGGEWHGGSAVVIGDIHGGIGGTNTMLIDPGA